MLISSTVEQPDSDLLAPDGLDPNGALYKMFNTYTSSTSSVEKRTRRDEPNDDLAQFVGEINRRSGDQLKSYVFDHVDIPAVLNYLAASVITRNNDQSAKNYVRFDQADIVAALQTDNYLQGP